MAGRRTSILSAHGSPRAPDGVPAGNGPSNPLAEKTNTKTALKVRARFGEPRRERGHTPRGLTTEGHYRPGPEGGPGVVTGHWTGAVGGQQIRRGLPPKRFWLHTQTLRGRNAARHATAGHTGQQQSWSGGRGRGHRAGAVAEVSTGRDSEAG